jgi:predicted nuclease with TOPRIM domain
MSDKALQLIDEIRFRSLEIKGKLDEERQNNAVLTNTIADLGKELEQRELELSEVKTKVAELEKEVLTAKEQVINPVISSERNDEEIDELVKEIEYCISQLKNNK